ncbi:hypothetical protein P4657_06320, partial [Halalkalibacterium halodurans]|uniref:hypothetical protein n=1 Tax=Halalkalibacterium halodurans TaxID=86665 RepID=UPI0030C975E0
RAGVAELADAHDSKESDFRDTYTYDINVDITLILRKEGQRFFRPPRQINCFTVCVRIIKLNGGETFVTEKKKCN